MTSSDYSNGERYVLYINKQLIRSNVSCFADGSKKNEQADTYVCFQIYCSVH